MGNKLSCGAFLCEGCCTRAKVAAQPPDVGRLTTWGTLKSALQLNATLQLNPSCGLASNFMTHNTFVTQHNLVTK